MKIFTGAQERLNSRIRAFFMSELKKEFKDDFELVSDKVDSLINEKSLKEARYILNNELNKIKNQRQD